MFTKKKNDKKERVLELRDVCKSGRNLGVKFTNMKRFTI